MKVLVFGSFNIDRVYTLARLPERGETLYCENYEIHVGGKGLNQALAFQKAGAQVVAAGGTTAWTSPPSTAPPPIPATR